MHIGSTLLVMWLIVGAVAAWQRGYYNEPVVAVQLESRLVVGYSSAGWSSGRR